MKLSTTLQPTPLSQAPALLEDDASPRAASTEAPQSLIQPLSEDEMLAFLPPDFDLQAPVEVSPADRQEVEPEPVSALPMDEPEAPPQSSPSPAPEAPSPKAPGNARLEMVRAQIEASGKQEQIRAGIKTALNIRNPRIRESFLGKVDALAKVAGATREDVMGAFGLKAKVTRPATRLTEGPARPRAISQDPDDPNSPNYRFRDTGYVPGSRKEFAEMIRRAGRDGRQLKASEINWEDLDRNPREAAELITKSNLFGTVDWEKLREGGMEPGAGFLVDRVYAAIGKEPSVDAPQARRDYAVGLETIREKMEACKTPDDVSKVLDELKAEFEGISLNPTEAMEYKAIQDKEQPLWERKLAFSREDERLYGLVNATRNTVSAAEYAQTKRTRRGWQPDPDIEAALPGLRAKAEEAYESRQAFRAENPFFVEEFKKDPIPGSSRFQSPMNLEFDDLRRQRQSLFERAKVRNLAENPFHRALNVMGDRFINVLKFRSSSGSDAFANHMATAKAGRIHDWSWAEKEQMPAIPKATQESVRFQLKVADSFDRVGGTKIHVDSTEALKASFGLRDVQSGNYVLGDFNSAKFHIERCAEALADLSDLMGVLPEKMGLQGQLAMAFGARGKGNAGWKGAASAEYSPTYRVTNLTKNKGGGALAHEWFHSLDNMAAEFETGKPAGKDDFLTENPDLLPEGKLKDSVKQLVSAIWSGNHRVTKDMSYTAQDFARAKREFTGFYSRQGTRSAVVNAGSVDKAFAAIERAYPVKSKEEMATSSRYEQKTSRSNAKQKKAFMELAVAWYGGNPEGGSLSVPISKPMSSYAYEAHKLDGGKTAYWSQGKELAARAFHAFVEDKLAAQGRRCDYLSVMGDNKFYNDPFFGQQKPYPEGEERTRINAAFDSYIAALGEAKWSR